MCHSRTFYHCLFKYENSHEIRQSFVSVYTKTGSSQNKTKQVFRAQVRNQNNHKLNKNIYVIRTRRTNQKFRSVKKTRKNHTEKSRPRRLHRTVITTKYHEEEFLYLICFKVIWNRSITTHQRIANKTYDECIPRD